MTGENIEYRTRNYEFRSEILRCAQNDKNEVQEWNRGLPISRAVAYLIINL